MEEKSNYFVRELICIILFSFLFICFLSIPIVNVSLNNRNDINLYLQDILINDAIINDGIILINYKVRYIVLSSLLSLIGAFILYFFALNSFFKKDRKSYLILFSISILLQLYSVLSILFTNQYYINFGGEGVSEANITLLFGIIYSLISAFIIFIDLSYLELFKDKLKFTVQEIVEIAVFSALAIVLDQFNIKVQVNGGSISFSAVPLFIIAIRHGGFKGFIASSLIFGFISCLFDGYGLQTYSFDYFLALSGYGFVGTFTNLFMKFGKDNKRKQYVFANLGVIIGVIFATTIRYIGHMISGAILYQPITFVENFIYQSSYVPLSMVSSLVIMLVLLYPILVINRVFPVKKYGK